MIDTLAFTSPSYSRRNERGIGISMLAYELKCGHTGAIPKNTAPKPTISDPVLRYMEEPRSLGELAARFAVTSDAMRNMVATLFTQGLVEKIGPKNAMRYRVKP